MPLTHADIAALKDQSKAESQSGDTLIDDVGGSASPNSLGPRPKALSASSAEGGVSSERVIVGNLTKDQALMICGPIGEDFWAEIGRIEVKQNNAEGNSTMVAYATSLEALGVLIDRQDKRIEAERQWKERAKRRDGA